MNLISSEFEERFGDAETSIFMTVSADDDILSISVCGTDTLVPRYRWYGFYLLEYGKMGVFNKKNTERHFGG